MITRFSIFVTCALFLMISVAARAQSVYLIDSGTMSIRLDEPFLSAAGLTVTTIADTATPALGFDAGFDITDTTDFCFTIDPVFTAVHGSIRHSGSINFDQGKLGTFAVGNFQLAYGIVTPDKFELYDTLLGTRLFELGEPDATTLTGKDFAFGNADLIVTPEFADFLGDKNLSGQVAGQLRIDGAASLKPVPEPHTALLAGAGLLFLTARRRRF